MEGRDDRIDMAAVESLSKGPGVRVKARRYPVSEESVLGLRDSGQEGECSLGT